ncbi:MAG: Rpn family recombination-promoting nuclease/putative transposase [Caldilinea sp.]
MLGELHPILPVIFYQGESRWHHSTEFADLFDKSHQNDDFLPRFAHFLIDQSDLPVEQTQGGLKAQVAQLLMMAAFQKSTRKALQHAAQLLAQVAQTGGTNYMEFFVVYLVATQERRLVQEFVENLQQYTVDIGGEMLTYAEELKQEGEIRGEIKTIDSLLSAGVEWALITKATGITPQRFQALKEQLRQLSSSN